MEFNAFCSYQLAPEKGRRSNRIEKNSINILNMFTLIQMTNNNVILLEDCHNFLFLALHNKSYHMRLLCTSEQSIWHMLQLCTGKVYTAGSDSPVSEALVH